MSWHSIRRLCRRRRPRSPSPLLQALLCLLLLALACFVHSEADGSLLGIETPQFRLEKGQWILLFGVVAAIVGWIISSMVAIRNGIRQHTINILLQSRLSQTYMEQAMIVHMRYFHRHGMRYLTEEEIETDSPDARLPSLRYVLSYLEFIAVGIRYGDLDEKLMRRTLRDVVCSLYEASGALIAGGPRTAAGRRAQVTFSSLENLSWLYELWYDKRLQRPRVVSFPPPADTAASLQAQRAPVTGSTAPLT
ncbi:DUF4760 domain-containing protein [Variovorax sp. Sphag1AA]|uniref:DUF4760 domain-containing protein n=1 Tax=Variovorax sp. Sphag1AA TaxID=2587027 RepID=UPI0016146F8E|nr:DUF4760 domain-containing protein [Variovorax sp. Sphag1AA]MBB3178746.1 hypothetical protein [Variovorax sp. Sphag1AA]